MASLATKTFDQQHHPVAQVAKTFGVPSIQGRNSWRVSLPRLSTNRIIP
ncbi:hypothetical protein [Rubripirellula lacrimiformis]|nr:hypothetical protein [Rubripirellula lacrimiformis]